MNSKQQSDYINKLWDDSIIPELQTYISIPNKSPHFDPDWKKNGHMDKAVKLITDWCKNNALPDMTIEVVELDGRTPVILMEAPGDSDETVLMYGHLDKQPEMVGWDDDLGPWKPVMKGDKLYGRGGADDGYSAFASLTALKAMREQNIKRARCVILIEACEESGSYDLPYYIDHLKDRIGSPSLIVCLDSGCGNYDQLWMTTSLRGLAGGVLKIEVLKEGVHSGNGSGIAPSCIRILRQLLNRIENETTGDVIIDELHVNIPEERKTQADKAASVLGDMVYAELPFIDNVKPESDDLSELVLRRTWKPALSVIGTDGIPAIKDAGNVTLPTVSAKLSMRLPPTCNPVQAAEKIKAVLENEPPHHCRVHFEIDETGPGWNAPAQEQWLVDSANQASQNYFGKEAMYMGEGGSIPFMGMLGEKFPQAQFVITGVLGPASNAHGPNEFLHIPTAKKLTACVAHIIADHFNRNN
jgi:acetylornithine deacetylase/succinyl-diaminopimelate desuccinylase-like protein